MPTRLMFNGEMATAGQCCGCTGLVIVTDRASDGSFKTYHQDPMCEWYIKRNQLSEAVGLHVMTAESDPSGTIRVKAEKPAGNA